ncbi:MAG: DotD/TraH family lipoprotein [Alphaproteobacteria bacterium]|nr:DotD/TraH family lipoprotein [Alphaproteobacteria bacterium]NCQ88430.1 DotD/TraH family lipoprotein [Alphaproteobacteria bacterium]NCT05973.1 DotD/TraH family lipoprotein [Alphaproteobacteria bacterium]
MIRQNKILFLAVAALSLTSLNACETLTNLSTERDPQVLAAPDKISLMLADAADKTSRAMETLAAVKQAKSPAIAVQPIHNAPPELQRAITVSWIGPAEEITKQLADRASYTFLRIGDPPPVPMVVNIDAENKPVVDVLRDIGLQLGMRADVKVDSIRRTVEIHYAPVIGLGG